jgi:putative ABC transport system permease protein
MDNLVDISLPRLAFSFLYVVAVVIIVRQLRIPREQQIVVASLRMTIQLIIAGYLLVYIFDNRSLWIIALVLVVMESFAVYNAIKRTNLKLSPAIKRIMAIAIPVGSLVSLAFFLVGIVGGDAWQNPQYVIPLAGMIVGNAMTGVALGTNRLVDGMRTHRASIETALMLGATPQVASHQVVRNAFDAALLPTINSMVSIGIVALPGMMSGQILSGISPLIAIRYQIAIMLGIMGGVAFSVLIIVQWGFRTFFNSEAQLVEG